MRSKGWVLLVLGSTVNLTSSNRTRQTDITGRFKGLRERIDGVSGVRSERVKEIRCEVVKE